MNDLTLIETIKLMEEYKRRGFDVYFSGECGVVKAFVEGTFVVSNSIK